MTYTTGHFHNSTGTGSKFLPIHHPKNDFERFIDDTLRIQWCPNEKHFVVMIEGVPYQLISARSSTEFAFAYEFALQLSTMSLLLHGFVPSSSTLVLVLLTGFVLILVPFTSFVPWQPRV
jgi:hypothetical protein